MPTTIVQTGHPVLQQVAEALPLENIATPATKRLIAAMSAALAEHEDGVALAAPQIGVSRRVFIVSGRLLAEKREGAREEKVLPDLVFINPKIIKISRKRLTVEEGCLSVRWLYGETRRAERASIEAYDERGQKFIRHASGLLAQVFQHEIDHLNGVLFTDHAKKLREMKPEGK